MQRVQHLFGCGATNVPAKPSQSCTDTGVYSNDDDTSSFVGVVGNVPFWYTTLPWGLLDSGEFAEGHWGRRLPVGAGPQVPYPGKYILCLYGVFIVWTKKTRVQLPAMALRLKNLTV